MKAKSNGCENIEEKRTFFSELSILTIYLIFLNQIPRVQVEAYIILIQRTANILNF